MWTQEWRPGSGSRVPRIRGHRFEEGGARSKTLRAPSATRRVSTYGPHVPPLQADLRLPSTRPDPDPSPLYRGSPLSVPRTPGRALGACPV